MNTKHSFGTRFLALMLSVIMVLGMVPAIPASAEEYYEARIGDELYETLREALEAVPAGPDAPETTITLLQSEVACSFDVGEEDGSNSKKIVLDLAGNILKLTSAVGSAGTKSNGIRVLANSSLTVKNGHVKCSSAVADNIKIGISNYGTLELHSVVLEAGSLTFYSINNRGQLILSGDTWIADGKGPNFLFGITNDPYEYIYTDTDAVVNCNSANVYVQSMQVERYERETTNAGGVVLNITAGTFGRIVEGDGTAVDVEYNVSGGTIGASTAEELADALKIAEDGAVIKLMNDVTLGFDVGAEDGSVSANVVLDLNNYTLTTAPAVGSAGTKTNGIRVLANSALKLMNGTVVIPDAADDLAVKIGIANYGNLRLSNIDLKAGNVTAYTINNRGVLTLSGKTTVSNGSAASITNDPYDYIYSNQDAILNIADDEVVVGKVLVERYERATTNAGGVVLNIAAGNIASVVTDNGEFVNVTGNITGGVFGNDVTGFVQEGYECVQQENGQYQVRFIKLEQMPLVFENPGPITVTYGETEQVTNLASGGSAGGKITYELIAGDSVTVDAESGAVSVKKAGTSKIQATMEGNETYKPVSAVYEVIVNRADRTAAFAKVSDTVYYGTVSVTCPELVISAGSGVVSYQVISGEDIAVVDENGLLTFKDCAMGTVTVRATVAADDCYNSCYADYTVTVEPLPTPAVPYEAEGIEGMNGWFNGDVVISAPGYTMSKSNSMTGEWVEHFTYTEEGEHEEYIYLRDENGFITDRISLRVKIDKTAPSDLKVTYGNYTWFDELQSMLGSNKTVDVTFSFVENGSGPAYVEYSLDGGKTYQSAAFADGVYSASVEPQYRGYVQFRVKDASGLEAICNADGTLIVVDKEAPGITVGYTGDYDKETDENGVVIVNTAEESFTIIFTVTDENLDLQKTDPVLTVTDGNNNELALSVIWGDITVEGVHGKQASLTLTDVGTYNILLTCSDRTNTRELRMQVIVDRTPSALEAVKGSEPVRTEDGIAYYGNDGAKVKVNIRKNYFRSDRAGIEILYGEQNISSKYNEYGITVSRNWANESDYARTKEITFGSRAPEGIYKVRVSYKEGYGKGARYVYSEYFTFVLDKSDPTVSVTYQENGKGLISAIINGLGFSYAQNKVDVIIKAEDSMSGIHHVVYEIGDGVEHTITADQLSNGEYTFSIEEEYRDMVRVKAVDMVNHTTEATGHNTVVIDHQEASFGVTGMGSKGEATATKRDDGVKVYTTADKKFNLIFEVTQQNFDISTAAPVIEYRREGTGMWVAVDNKYLTRTDLTDDEGVVIGSNIHVAMPDDVTADNGTGDYEFRCTYSLFKGWEHSSSAMGVVHFDANPPQITTIYKTEANKNPDQNSKMLFFHEAQTVTIQVKEKNFSAADVQLKVLYAPTKDGVYEELTKYSEDVKVDNNWLHGLGNVHTVNLEFSEEGFYKLEITCIDTLQTQSMQNVADEFVIDLQDPTALEIRYEEQHEWVEILEKLYAFFNLKTEDGGKKDQLTVTLAAEDTVSGIRSIQVSVDGREFQEADYNDGVFSFSMDEGFRGQLTILVTDGAMRTSRLMEQGAIVVDSIDPLIDEEYSADHNVYDDIIYTAAQNFKISFVVKDANYDLRAQDAVVKIGEQLQDLVWVDDQIQGMPCGRTTLVLTEEGKHLVSAEFADRSGNRKVWNETVVVDRHKPVIDVTFTDLAGNIQEHNDGAYYNTAEVITIRVTEPNFRPELVDLVITGEEEKNYDDYVHDIQNWTTEGDQHTLIIKLDEDDKYELNLTCEDMAGNSSNYSTEFTVDQTAPEVELISYSSNVLEEILEDLSLGFFRASVTVTIKATDETSGVKTISYTAVGTEGINSEKVVQLEGSGAPDQAGNISFKIEQAFYGNITAMAVDNASNVSAVANVGYHKGQELKSIVVDGLASERVVKMSPVRIVAVEGMADCADFAENEQKVLYFKESARMEIILEEDNFYSSNYVVAVNGTEYDPNWVSNGIVHTGSVVIEENGDYEVTVSGRDYSGNEMVSYKSQRIVVDDTAPVISVDYTMMKGETPVDVTEQIIGAEGTAPAMDGPVAAHVLITEHNFRAEDVKILVSAKNSAGVDVLELDENGDVKLYMDQGRSQNEKGEDEPTKWSAFTDGKWRRKVGKTEDQFEIDLYFNTDATYTVQVICEDLSKNIAQTEQVSFTVDNVDPVMIVEGVEDGKYYNDFRTVTLKIQEENFDSNGVVFEYAATNANGDKIDLSDLMVNKSWESNADKTEWSMTLELNKEANYTLSLRYTDRSGRTGKVIGTRDTEIYQSAFTIDKSVPRDLSISYKDCISEKESVKYYDGVTDVVLRATDDTAGMMAFKIKLINDKAFEAATDWEVSTDMVIVAYNEDLKALNEQLSGLGMKFQIYGENSRPYYANGEMVVTVRFYPQFRGDISFEAIDLAGLSAEMMDATVISVDNIDPVVQVELPDPVLKEEQTWYYGSDRVSAKLTMNEANFYGADPVFKVNGVATELNWTPTGEDNKIHTAEYIMTAEGSYVLTLEYTDRSGNRMESYLSEEIIIDRTKPVIQVSYDLTAPESSHDGRDYYSAVRTATITVNEHNFDAQDVEFTVKATDINGNAVQQPVKSDWVSSDDVHTLTMVYAADANYTFDVAYADKSGNEAADYAEDLFTVDTTKPTNVSITYSKSVQETLLGTLTFGFYDAKVTVSLESHDVTAGIETFMYSYIKADKVSDVNAGKTDLKVAAVRDGDKATATFQIPESALTNATQFNGTVTVTAIDRSNNRTTTQDDERIVVDNISPTATITYNEPVQIVDGTAYYAGNINAQIRITEANFYKSDVSINVTRDGVKYTVDPDWNENSVDVHTGTFTLSQEGDYIVTVTYKDKSGNAMSPYTSGKMVIDQAAPTIHVSNVVANSANDDEVYTFSITVDDADGNLRGSDVHPVLSAVVRDENGNHTTKTIDLGAAKITAVGKTYVYTVENLEQDAIYTLSCSAVDLAGNSVNVITLDDGQSYNEVSFSINRNGSTFMYGNEETRELAENYYVQNVDHDVVIHEINVDPVHNYSITLNGVELKEGEDYTTTISGGGNKWSLREYVINRELFAEEGEYSVVIKSVDATEATAYSDMKHLNMSFVVDRTAPTVVIGGLDEGGRYQNDGQVVTLIPNDEGGMLSSVVVLLYPDNANVETDEPTAVLFDMSGAELREYLDANGGVVTFVVPQGYYHTVHIVCSDYAQGEEAEVNVSKTTITEVTVSTNFWLIFFANKPLFYGGICGILALLSFIFFLIFKKKKREEETAEQTNA